MEKAFHVQRVAAKIKATERSIEEAMTLAADLMVEMKAAQDGLELGPIVTDSAFAKLAETMGDLAKARTELRASAAEGGKLPAEAAAYLGLVDLAAGQRDKARTNLERLARPGAARVVQGVVALTVAGARMGGVDRRASG